METYSFGEWLVQRRKQLRLPRQAVAKIALCSAAMIRKIEADERVPSVELAYFLAKAMELDPEHHDIFVACARRERPLDALVNALQSSAVEEQRSRGAEVVPPPLQLTRPTHPFYWPRKRAS